MFAARYPRNASWNLVMKLVDSGQEGSLEEKICVNS